MGYNSPPGDEIAQLFTKLDDAFRRISELERPTGTQVYDALAELRQLVEDLPGEIDAALAIAVNTGNVTATGDITAAGAINSGGRGTFTGGVTSADVKTRTLAVGYDSVYIDANNIFGLSPSGLQFKQDVRPHTEDPYLIDLMESTEFRLIGAVEELGDDAPFERGYIAQQLEEIGLGAYVTRDADGQPAGIAYERLTVPLVSAVQVLRAEMREVRALLDLPVSDRVIPPARTADEWANFKPRSAPQPSPVSAGKFSKESS